MDFGSMIYVNEMCMSSNAQDMDRGRGKKVGGIYGFANQGYVQFMKVQNNLEHRITIGRAYLEHGFGKSSRLLVSKWSRPFDQIGWSLLYKGISAKMVGVQLDPIEDINRYFSIHVINFDLLNNLTISFGESSIYAGENRGIELQYFNPTLFWIPIRENQPSTNQANGFLYTGIKYNNLKNAFWFEYLLDDYQIDRTIQEPTTYGFIVGIEKVDLFIKYFDSFWAEYSKVSNRTYQTMGELGEENYIHRSFPIGHYLGNDFDNLVFNVKSKNLSRSKYDFYSNFKFSFLRDGNSGIEIDWDSPWLDIEEGVIFEENSPTLPINQILEFVINANLQYEKKYIMDLGLYYKSSKSKLQNESDLSFLFRISMNFISDFNY
tara:strand:- start:3631 stop:4761 length:1131 start_codon:yes stop_codon:yes gene_type:complete